MRAVWIVALLGLPSLEKTLEDAGGALGAWTYLLVGVFAFLETGAFVGLIAPGETVILIGGVVAGQGKIDIVALIAVVWACAVAGDMASFHLGRRLGREFLLRHGGRVRITEARVAQVEGFFARHGGKAVFLGRFVGLVRAVAPFLAGSGGMPLRRFAPSDVLGAGLWGSTFALLGYFFWHSLDQVLAIAKKGSLALGAAIVLVVAIVWAVRRLRSPEVREQLRAGGSALLARATPGSGVPGQLALELTGLLAVASVGAFVCLGYAISLSADKLTPGDRRGLRWADDLRTGWLDDVARAVTHLGTLPVAAALVVAAMAVLIGRRRFAEGAALAGGLALTYAGVHVLKAMEDRPRPAHSLVATDGSSYPSGHAAYAVAWIAIAVALRHAIPRLGARAAVLIAAFAVALAVGLTRIELRAHYFSDVAGGWGLGALAFSAAGAGALAIGHLRQTGGDPD